MNESTTVTVGLDVHAHSIRLAAVRANELLEERALPYDEEAVERALRRWPQVRYCYEAGPTGFGLYRHLVERGLDCQVVAPGLVPQRPGIGSRPTPRDARRLARLLAGGLLEPIQVPSPELEAARDLVRARARGRPPRSHARSPSAVEVLPAARAAPAGQVLGITRRRWLAERRFPQRMRPTTRRTLEASMRYRFPPATRDATISRADARSNASGPPPLRHVAARRGTGRCEQLGFEGLGVEGA